MVSVCVEVVKVPLNKLHPLMLKHVRGDQPDFSDLRNEMQKLVKVGSAEILESTAVRTKSGEAAKINFGEDFLFPTEFEFLEFEPEIGDQGRLRKLLSPISSEFYIQSLGVDLEVVPVISGDQRFVDTGMSLHLVDHVGDYDHGLGAKVPRFYSQRVVTNFSSFEGGVMLLTTFTPPDAKGNPDRHFRNLVFARVEAVEE